MYAAGGEAQAARVTAKEPEPEQELPGDDDDDGICFGADPATVADTADDDIGGLEYAAAQTGGKKKRRGHRNRELVRSQPATCSIWPIAHSLRLSRRTRRRMMTMTTSADWSMLPHSSASTAARVRCAPLPPPFSSARIETRALTVMGPLVRQVRGAVYAHDVERSAPSSNGGAGASGAAVNSQVAAMFSATRAWEAKN